MTLVTAFIPTHIHADTIEYAVKSILSQTIQDFEVFVVGDGQPKRTDEIIERLCSEDDRIRYFPNEKGEGHGEIFRHMALQEAKGRYVSYLGDDDLWLPYHLEVMVAYLEQYDFVHTFHLNIDLEGNFSVICDDVQYEITKHRMKNQNFNIFGLSCAGHTMEAYRKLPFGWRPKPEDIPSDLHMWRQWLSQDWTKMFSIPKSTTLKLPSKARVSTSMDDRLLELDQWYQKSLNKDFQKTINDYVLGSKEPFNLQYNWIQLVNTLLKHNEKDDALKTLWMLLGVDPSISRIWDKLMDIYLESGDINSARALHDLAVKIDENAFSFYCLGRIELRDHNLDKAIQALDKALQMDDKMVRAYAFIIQAYLGKNELDLAYEYIQKARIIAPKNPQFSANLGQVMFGKGKLNDALDQYEQAISMNPGNGRFCFLASFPLEKLNRLNEAISYAQKAFELNPENDQYNKRIIYLKKIR